MTTPAQIKNQARQLRDRASELRSEDPGANTPTQVVADIAGASRISPNNSSAR